MVAFNSVTFVGNAGTGAELHTTEDGNSVARFRLAVTTDFKDREKEPLWLTIIAFGKLAVQVSELVQKGGLVLVSGRLSIRSYTDKQGGEKTAVEVVAQNVQVLPTYQTKAEEPAPKTAAAS
jgi:single-strand DNA-binding protein